MDARYFNKYGEYLRKRFEDRNYYERLNVEKGVSSSQVKKSYFKMALVWHPDNIK